MQQITFEKFKENPLMYLLFLPLLAMVVLFWLFKDGQDAQIKDKNEYINRVERREEKKDSINHILYEKLGAKKIIDTLNAK